MEGMYIYTFLAGETCRREVDRTVTRTGPPDGCVGRRADPPGGWEAGDSIPEGNTI